jgi:predicted RecB family nuclease
MYLTEEQLVLSPSDLNGFVECRHLTQLDRLVLAAELERPEAHDPVADLLSRKGDEHERAYLEQLKSEDRSVIELPDAGRSIAELEEAAAATLDALREGPEVIFQATFLGQGPAGADGRPTRYRGHTDFLLRVDGRPSDLGNFSYEVADTKLARKAKPYFILQLCFYSEMLQAAQGGEVPERMRVILGDRTTETYRLAEFSSYFRRVRSRFLESFAVEADTYPEPVAHCSVCRWMEHCDAQRVADDHLSLVAGITRSQRAKLVDAGITTLAALGDLDAGGTVPGIRPEQLEKRREQARLQLLARESGEQQVELLPPDPARGFARLPRPSEGDVFFDLEGDPFYDDGLEYLWGFVTDDSEDGSERFTSFWGRDRREEREAFESFVDFVVQRRERWPDLHVYHYANYEITVLKRLAGRFASREAELDQLLRDGVFVDLYRVVVEAMRVGMPSYGLKHIEAFYMEERGTTVTDGADSVIEFEKWLDAGGADGGDPAILARIEEYNRDDCVSTLRLRDWLLDRRGEAEGRFGAIEWFERPEGERSNDAIQLETEIAELVEELTAGLPEEAADYSKVDRARELMSNVVTYHQREARPVWWAFFARIDGDHSELVDDIDCIGGLVADEATAPQPTGRDSTLHRLHFPAQETKLGLGGVHDPAAPSPAVTVTAIDPVAGWLDLKRGARHAANPLPQALIPGGPYNTREHRAALRRLAQVVVTAPDGDGPFRACRDLLLGRVPRVRDLAPGRPLYSDSTDIDELRALVSRLDETTLVVQGPPGSGKTYAGARLITHLIAGGNRVGVAAPSHKAIENLLREVETAADEDGLDFHGLKKQGGGEKFESRRIMSTDSNAALTAPDVKLAAGTSWHFARPETDETLDYLFIDEAGQVSLADALAMGTAARNIVLLGDPQQLPQVIQGAHPDGAACSALEHVLAGRQTIPPTDGVFLDRTWRLHPDLSRFCSELMYDGRLESAPGRELQEVIPAPGSTLGGAGLRWVPVEHEARTQSSEEEADRIAGMLEELLAGARCRNFEGNEHDLTLDDILVITPFNAQVKCLEARLPPGARVGTVDKFQGQEAQVVFFSLATSSGAEVPRSLEFLLSRNRLNVAVSRARCLAFVVASPGLLDIDCATVAQMRLVNALCRVAEAA